MKKVLSILLVMVMLVAMGTTCVFAAGEGDEATEKTISLDPSKLTPSYTDTASGIQTIGEEIIGVIQVVGSVVAVVILIIIGIKYMMGSASEKAEYKKTLMPYLIGAVLIFAASNLAGVVYKWSASLGNAAVGTETEAEAGQTN